ncbi:MAG: hypothetical protein ACT4O3_02210, partial [Elusimicrobiota bacterium]
MWRNFIAGHTSGLVSRKSKIYIQFQADIFPKEREGKEAKRLLNIKPGIDGVPVIAGPREIVLIPKGDLEPGAHYLVRLTADQVPGIPAKTPDFEFTFQVLAQDFSVALDGLIANEAVEREWVLKGRLVTADTAEVEKVEKMLSAELSGQSPAVQWTHEENGTAHAFTVSGIHRQKDAQTLKLTWEGKRIGAERSETQEVEVPAQSDFKVMEVKALQDKPQSVAVYFSDPLNPRQNMKGLAKLDQGRFTSQVEGNVLKLFPEQR